MGVEFVWKFTYLNSTLEHSDLVVLDEVQKPAFLISIPETFKKMAYRCQCLVVNIMIIYISVILSF